MKPDILFENFEMLADAPNGVAKLREMILQYAFQGKLVPQDPKDKPASVLLSEISAEIELFIRNNKIRVTKFNSVLDDDLPYDLPEKWLWCNFDNIVKFITDFQANGSFATLKKNVTYYNESNYAILVRLTDLRNHLRKEEDFVFTDAHGYNFLKKSFLQGGEILVANVGAGVGTSLVMPRIDKKATLAPNMFKVIISELIERDYFIHYCLSPLFWSYIEEISGGTGQPKINKKEYRSIKIPIPPQSEQKRIVEKINQLMPLCDKLEAQKQKRDDSRIVLNDASLERLLSAQQQEDFDKHWSHISNNFDLLYHNPENVDKLRQAILQLAVQGKLVPQDPNNEPAAVLIDKIKAEKDRLFEEKTIKKTKPLKPLQPDEIPYELPNGWEWTSLSEIGLINPRNTIEDNQDVSFIPMKFVPTILGEQVRWETRKWRKIKKGFTHFAEGDVALAKITPCFQNRKSAVMRNLKNGFGAGTTELHIFRPIIRQIVPDFILIYLKTPKFITDGVSKMTGSAGQKRVPKSYFSENPFPLPPKNEQKRIVAKVNQLLTLCDDLETKLSQFQSGGEELLSAIVNQREVKISYPSKTASDFKVVPQDFKNEPFEKPLERIHVEREVLTSNKYRIGQAQRKKSGRGKKSKSIKMDGEKEPEPAAIPEPISHKKTTQKVTHKKRVVSKIEKRFEKQDVLKAYRKAIYRRNGIDELTLLKSTGQRLGVKKLSQQIRKELRSYIKIAIRRKILYRDNDGFSAGAPTIEYYEDDFLIKVLRSVIRKGWEYPRDYLVDEAAGYLGFDKASDAFKDRMKLIFRKAIRQKALYRNGTYVGKV